MYTQGMWFAGVVVGVDMNTGLFTVHIDGDEEADATFKTDQLRKVSESHFCLQHYIYTHAHSLVRISGSTLAYAYDIIIHTMLREAYIVDTYSKHSAAIAMLHCILS
jgi:hypothetical protein